MSIASDSATLAPESRVWIYQADRPFSEKDLPRLRSQIRQFAESWISHNRQLKAYGDVVHSRFLVLMVDESQADASGCSIDKSVAFLKALQQEYGVDLFDRMRFSFQNEQGEVITLPREEFEAAFHKGQIHDQTPVFDTLVATKADFEKGFVKPLAQSWHRRMV